MTRAQDPNVGYDIVPRRKNNYPRMNGEFADLRKAIGDFILDDNNKLRVDKNTIFFLQGSCFAENLHAELKASGYPCIYNQVIEALNSPLANLLQFQAMARDHNAPVTAQFKQANVFVLTIGVAPCWYLRATGQFVLQPDPRNIGAFVQRTLTVKESTDALIGVFDLAYKINPDITIVLTLSPVPLGSTFEFKSAIIADCVSKSTLRAAIHEAITGYRGKKPIYFPAFEVVRWIGGHAGDAFGDDGLPRHVSQRYVKEIIASFLSRAS